MKKLASLLLALCVVLSFSSVLAEEKTVLEWFMYDHYSNEIWQADPIMQYAQDQTGIVVNVNSAPWGECDAKLNLIYLPTGNGPPDYWGGDRNAAKEKYGSSVVAVDASTGETKWVFQTVHHDIWDYDLPSQPVLFHMKNERGEEVPVLIQTPKTGQI